eukprot:TRINITY_DN5517_c0_g1_i2.p2 TRINITY_DN5517_c0_g1~~TRINITY_DN5517_c0_g1_i2.p2  ORF type:complete len:247 (-),score=51.95 TRINITY_DN5517_c0_g1_i2:82-822(-)
MGMETVAPRCAMLPAPAYVTASDLVASGMPAFFRMDSPPPPVKKPAVIAPTAAQVKQHNRTQGLGLLGASLPATVLACPPGLSMMFTDVHEKRCPGLGSRALSQSTESPSAAPSTDDPSDEDELETKNITTLMMNNLPARVSQEEIIAAVNQEGFEGMYSCLYLPLRSKHKQKYGYAFINFRDSASARQFSKVMTGYRFERRSSSKLVTICPAHVQGYANCLAHFEEDSQARARKDKATRCSLPAR